jgi:hypothetical protein
MKIFYAPDDGDPQAWDFDPARMLTSEAEAIETVTEMTYLEFGEALSKGSMKAFRALVWIMRKRHEDATLRYRDVDFPIGALTFENDEPEPADDEQADSPGPKEEADSPGDADG